MVKYFDKLEFLSGTYDLKLENATITNGSLSVTTSNNSFVVNNLDIDSEICTFDNLYT